MTRYQRRQDKVWTFDSDYIKNSLGGIIRTLYTPPADYLTEGYPQFKHAIRYTGRFLGHGGALALELRLPICLAGLDLQYRTAVRAFPRRCIP